MNWLQKVIKQTNRLLGTSISEEATEAEVVDAMESLESVSQLSEEALTSIESRLEALESREDIDVSNFVTQEALNEATTPLADRLQANEDSINQVRTDLEDNISTTRADLAAEINLVKTGSSSDGGTQTPAAPTTKKEGAEIDDEKKDTMTIKMDDLVNGDVTTSTVFRG